MKRSTIIVPYSDAEALDRILGEHEGEVAAVIMNVGVILPLKGYLKSVRDITRRHNVLLIFDEVKTGVTVAPGGITELYPVEPDLICLAKSIGAFGGREEIMRRINHSGVLHLGTFNGNPMSMRAGLVTLTQIFTNEAHAHANGLSAQLGKFYDGIIEEFDLPMHVAQIGAKGCAMFRYERAQLPRLVRDRHGCVVCLLALPGQSRYPFPARIRRSVDGFYPAYAGRYRSSRACLPAVREGAGAVVSLLDICGVSVPAMSCCKSSCPLQGFS